MKQGDVIRYRDELNDDFAGNGITAAQIGSDFPFAPKGVLWRIGEFAAYYLFALPVVTVICTVFGGMRFENRRAAKAAFRKGRGIFLYANHTHWLDAFAAPIVCAPHKAHVLVSPDTVSIKGIRTFVQMLGAIPVPTERAAVPLFVSAIEERINEGRAVMIFPEAHIWPYCSFVRNFKAGSFRYPVKLGAPCAAVCVTYQKRRLSFIKKPKRRVIVSEPFFPDASLPAPEAKQKLRDEIYGWLKTTAEKYSDYEYVRYVKED